MDIASWRHSTIEEVKRGSSSTMRCLLLFFIPAILCEDKLPSLPNIYKKLSDVGQGEVEKKTPEKLFALFPSAREKVEKSKQVLSEIASDAPNIKYDVPIIDETLKKRIADAKKFTEGDVIARPSLFEINRPISDYLYGGDILVGEVQLKALDEATKNSKSRKKRGAPVISQMKWPKSQPIPYSFLNLGLADTTKQLIRDALKIFEQNTCIRFTENKTIQGTRLVFFSGEGCYSYIGKRSHMNEQPVSIGGGCEYMGIVTHEITHALGIDHTQNRKDRDDFVTIYKEAITKDKEGNFKKIDEDKNDNFGMTYDYGSDLHYGPYDFSSNGDPTVVPKDIYYMNTIGQRHLLNFADFKMINTLYGCDEDCPTKLACQNGGYQSANDCNKCICTTFYEGRLCEKEVVLMTITEKIPGRSRYEQIYDKVLYTSGNTNNWQMFGHDYSKIIMAPVGKKIKVTIKKLYAAYGQMSCFALCPFNGIELNDGPDLTTGGKVFCCEKHQGLNFISTSNIIGYRAFVSPGMPFEAEVYYEVV